MSGRGRGRGRGRGGAQPSPNAVRGPQPSRGVGGGAGRGGGNNAPSFAGAAAPYQPSPSQSVTSLSREVEKISLHASSSSSSPTPATVAVVEAVAAPASLRNPSRPGIGEAGRRILVRANHFLVTVADRGLHHYDVSISPEVASKKVCRDIMKEFVNSYSESHLENLPIAYDGRKSCYTAGELPFLSKEFNVKLADKDGQRRERKFTVSIKFASKADLHHLTEFLKGRQLDVPQEALQFLDVVLRDKPSSTFEVVGRSFFAPELGAKGELGNGLEYWKGFYQSLRPTQMGLSLNIDISARAFLEPILVSEYVAKYINKDPSRSLSDQDRIKVKKALKGVRVEVDHSGHTRRHKILSITTEPVNRVMFTLDDSGAQISVSQYFKQQYNFDLKYPTLPAIQAGNAAKPISLPMEVCKIVPGQRYSKRLNERQVTALLRATCQRPHEREKSVTEMLQRLNSISGPQINTKFGITVKHGLTSIEARVLTPPMLKYHETGKESRVAPKVGQWNMIDKKMVNGGKVESWGCICFSTLRNLDEHWFCDELIRMCCSKGMEINPRPLFPVRRAHSNQIEKALYAIGAETSKNEKGIQLLIIILPDITGSYGKIKRVCETKLGIVSQCCQPKQAMKCSKQYLENVSLKINVKVGGRNTVLEQVLPCLSDMPTIIFGADVTHPQPGEDSSPSIAAVVASMDCPEVTKYRGLVSAQGHRDEIIKDLYNSKTGPKGEIIHGGMIREHLLAFYQANGKQKPAKIIFYRDGVSEGQFNQVLLHEVDAIRKACNSLEQNYMPRITFIVVQKRHHTRLFPANHEDLRSTDKSGNILPGTVVDTEICHPSEFDFYLCSHAGIHGTSRPAHYHVLYDENRFTADGLQILTYSLCYTYARCTRSVSLVPPVYYAHLAAFRARYYIEGLDSSDSGSAVPGGGTRDRNQEVRPLPVIKDNVKDVMFFC